MGAINYIGVVPEMRGNGYVRDLFARGTAEIQAMGCRRAAAEIDEVNHPALAACEADAYRFRSTITVLRKSLRA